MIFGLFLEGKKKKKKREILLVIFVKSHENDAKKSPRVGPGSHTNS